MRTSGITDKHGANSFITIAAPFEPIVESVDGSQITMWFTQGYVKSMLNKADMKDGKTIEEMGEANTITIGKSEVKEFWVEININSDTRLIDDATFKNGADGSTPDGVGNQVGVKTTFDPPTDTLTTSIVKIMKMKGSTITEIYNKENIQWCPVLVEQLGSPSDGIASIINAEQTAAAGAPIQFKALKVEDVNDPEELLTIDSDDPNYVVLSAKLGSSKDTAIVPAYWSQKGYVALYCLESPDVRFEDVVTIYRPRYAKKWSFQTCRKFTGLCEWGTLSVVGYSTSKPCPVGLKINKEGLLEINTSILPWNRPNKIEVKISGIRKGFPNIRLEEKSRHDFKANEELLNITKKLKKKIKKNYNKNK